jgi:starch-binding outer membrane protein, SusD/RagB family
MNLFRILLKMKISSVIFLFCLLMTNCDEFVKVDPPINTIVSETVFVNDETATAAIRGIYSMMMQSPGICNYDITKFSGLSSDELLNYQQGPYQTEFVTNSLDEANPYLTSLWSSAYQYIYQANTAIERLSRSNLVTTPVKNQLLGETRLVRSLCYFYLVNLWGDVPITVTSDYRINATISKNSVDDVYQFIISDLLEAISLFSDSYLIQERARPDRYAAMALLSRVYLYIGNWERAEYYSTQIISNDSRFVLESDVNSVFRKDSRETIWQIVPWFITGNTMEGSRFVLVSTPDDVALRPEIITMFSDKDRRLSSWVGSVEVEGVEFYFPYKYKVKSDTEPQEYYVVFRLAEQYLIRSEARAELDKLGEAVSDVDSIRLRAGLDKISDLFPQITKEEILGVVRDERRAELFCEWGHRWLDFKRNRKNGNSDLAKPEIDDDDLIYPIPRIEIKNNPNLMPQNSGY